MIEPFDARPLLQLTLEERRRLGAQLAALVTPQRLARIDEVLDARTRRIVVVFEDVYHPHNASAVLRTCEGLGVQDVHVVEGAKRFRPNVEIVHGAARWLTLHRWRKPQGEDIHACLDALRARGHRLVATSPGAGAVALGDVPVDRPLAVCFGTEETGLSSGVLERADVRLRVPMPGFTRSFNVSVTAALVLFDLTARLRASGEAWRLSPAEREDLRLLWLADDGRRARQLAREALAAAGLAPEPPPYFLDRPA